MRQPNLVQGNLPTPLKQSQQNFNWVQWLQMLQQLPLCDTLCCSSLTLKLRGHVCFGCLGSAVKSGAIHRLPRDLQGSKSRVTPSPSSSRVHRSLVLTLFYSACYVWFSCTCETSSKLSKLGTLRFEPETSKIIRSCSILSSSPAQERLSKATGEIKNQHPCLRLQVCSLVPRDDLAYPDAMRWSTAR